MPKPQGTLTAAQYQIMQGVWEAGAEGATVAEIWQRIAGERSVTRTTVLNQVDRLEKRGWLKRVAAEGAIHFVATRDRQAADARLAAEFVDGFFGGSTSRLFMSLADGRDIKESDLQRLRKLLADAARERRAKGGRS
jgi:predicted transcriptional regulator